MERLSDPESFAAGAAEMVRYLVGLGHTRIGFISGPLTVSTARYRREGFLSAMAAAGLAADLIEEGEPFSFAAVETAKPLVRRLRYNLPLNDSSGNVLVTTMIHGQGQGPAIAFGPGVQTTLPTSGSIAELAR